jgi:hypothetical protein
VFEKRMTLWLGKLQVEIMQLGAGTPRATRWCGCRRRRCCSPAISSNTARRRTRATRISRLAGDARRDRGAATREARARRGASLHDAAAGEGGLDGTRAFVTAMFEQVKRGARAARTCARLRETYDALKPKFGTG